jgi:hypothetical protein
VKPPALGFCLKGKKHPAFGQSPLPTTFSNALAAMLFGFHPQYWVNVSPPQRSFIGLPKQKQIAKGRIKLPPGSFNGA